MFPTDYIVYLQLLLFLFISPGLPRVLIVSHTLNYGLKKSVWTAVGDCLLYTSPSPRDGRISRMPSSA